jgi:arylsulfatase A-like enzyme/Tfp pilus assembly protein PilF
MIAGAGGTGCSSSPPENPTSEVMLLVTIDTLRSDRLGCGGDSRARTPFLDRLARRGTQMAVTISPTPLTLPSHATILSGLLPPAHGVRDNGAFRLPDDVPLVSEAFREAGWATAAFVAAVPVAARFGLDRGFDVYDDSHPPGQASPRPAAAGKAPSSFVERAADHVNRAALEWLDRRDSGPLFLWIHYFDPHSPYAPPRPLSRTVGGDAYRGEIAFTDREFGRLTRRLDERFAERRTCLTSDHGESLGSHGEESHGVFVYETTTRVPWILGGPGMPVARISKRATSLIEVTPTLISWAGLDSSELSEFIERLDLDPSESCYVESLYPKLRHGWAPLRGFRSSEWKVIRAPNPEIYDLVRDPGETNNLYESAEARERVGRFFAELENPRWNGRAPTTLPPDSEAEAALRTLGYVGTSRTSAEDDGDAPRPDPKSRIRIEGLLSRAGSALDAGNLRAARSVVSLALSIDPRNKETQLYLARIEAQSGNFERALEVFNWSLGLPPVSGNAYVHYERGRVALDFGRFDIAEESFARAVEHDPLNVDARYNWGVAAYQDGRFEDAAQRWRDTLGLEPDHGPTRTWLSDAEARLTGGTP